MTRDTHELTCRDVSDFLGAYFAGELAPRERGRFDGHVAECPDCQTYLSQYRMTRQLATAAFDDDAVDGGVPEELVEAILAARQGAPRTSMDRRARRRKR